ncbi:hypothetical protein I302_104556 [Kwoniella bestiolae CBS 10118]|uniref:DNA polymerase epsilon subunit D n=1 Tax=Kwoniella bestiolae CBS 10118 TaxID=1296100 RepID=A0A1B9GBL8_9TREE|nr:hypothetical protein I302_03261 [Kwoniella bestiolae CBS 10118]OCF28402.1 hypothetical protein I302_03261 [Kwoniella bestiolae CBS 10118]
MPPKPPAAAQQQPSTKQTPVQSASLAQQKANSSGIGEYELPKSNLTKLAKGSIPDNVKMQQDVTLALLRGSTLFINYLSGAHDQALARSGKTITASDVIKAIQDLDFGPSDALVPLLEQELQAYRNHIQAAKLAKKSASAAKGKGPRKSSGAANEGDDVEMVDDEEGEGENDDEEEEDEEGDVTHNGVGDESEVVGTAQDDEIEED